MGYQDVLRRATEEHVLYSVLLELTYRCNLNCFFCYNDLGLEGTPLALEDYVRLLEDLAFLQVMEVTLSGGEPLSSPVFWPVGRKARELGFVVRVKSNGHALAGAVARRLRDEVDPFVVEVSLHGASAEVHERQTRVAGSFKRLLENLEAGRALGLRFKINSTLTKWNEHQIEEMFALADGLGIRLEFDPVVTPRDNGERDPLAVSASDAGVRRLYEVALGRQQEQASQGTPDGEACLPPARGAGKGGKRVKNCGTGSSTLTIDPFGNVFPCIQWRRAVGNLHASSVREIWSGSAELGEIRRLNEAAGEKMLELGPTARAIGFCPALAEEWTGDPLALYPDAERKLRVIGELKGEADLVPISSRRDGG